MDSVKEHLNFYTPGITDAEAVQALIDLAQENKNDNETRKSQAIKYASLIENCSLSSFGARGYTAADKNPYFDEDESGRRIPIVRNTANAILSSFISWMTMDTPKPTFITTEGNWADKRQAEQLRKLVEAGFKDPQGLHPDTYELVQHALKIAAGATGSAAVKVTTYPGETKISHELKDTLDIIIDYTEMSTGDILSLGDKTYMDPGRLKAIYPGWDVEIDECLEDPPIEKNLDALDHKVRQMVVLYEGWRVTTGEVKGRYVCGLKDGTCFANEEYDYPTPPFAFLIFEPHLWGLWGHSMTHYIYESVYRDNAILHTIDTSVSRTNFSEIYAVLSNLVNPSDLDKIRDAQIIPVKNMLQIPKHTSPAGFNEAHLQLSDVHRKDAYEMSGMPEAKAGSKAEPGISSAIGQQAIAALVNKRFAGVQNRFIKFCAVTIPHLDIRAMREVYKRDGGFSKKWNGGKFLQEIDGKALDLDDDRYVISGEAVSQNKNTPAERVQAAENLFKIGSISADTFATVQADYDTPDAIRDDSATVRWLEKQMYRWCYSPDEEVSRPDFYKGPYKNMNLDYAVTKVLDGFYEADYDGLEDDRLWFFMQFLSDLDSMIQARAAFMKSLQEGPMQAAPGNPLLERGMAQKVPGPQPTEQAGAPLAPIG